MPLFLAASAIAGFGISAFSASLAYSFLGINNYFFILFIFGLSLWILIYIVRKHLQFRIRKIKGFLSFSLISATIALYFSKSQWDSNLRPRIFASIGPDVSQNLLAATTAQNLGNTWFESSKKLIDSLGVNNINEAVIKLFEIPSFVHLAGYDYLVMGVRWGLTVPVNQMLKFLGPQAIMLEIGAVLSVTLFITLLIGFAIFRMFKKSVFFSAVGAAALALNGSFINQYYNGGISQALGLIGNFGILFILAIIISDLNLIETKMNKVGIFITSTLAWILSAISYVDSTLIIALLLFVSTLILLVKSKDYGKKFFSYLIMPGFVALAINPVFVYAIYVTLSYRFAANLGTGINTGSWRMPTQNFGFLPLYSEFSESQSLLIKLVSILILIFIIMLMINATFSQPKLKSPFSVMLWSSTTLMFLGFLFAFTSKNQSDYLYNKMSTYIAPFFILSLMILIDFKKNKLLNKLLNPTYIVFPAIILVSSISIENSFASSTNFTTILPSQYDNLFKDEKIKNYLEGNNYILPYKAAYNYTGLFGLKYWISKAPNDYDLNIDSRIDKPLLLLCFVGDNICNPKTQVISHPLSVKLSKYGVVEYESNLSTSEYRNLTIPERYNYAFDIMGTDRVLIPEKYLGGNPYLK